ncbi:uncharacterized protein BJ171DRAFT_505117 [Polychytrium aggregatum]|uniref:uncharacterized protein n=1 Tax=Polychytrium aggregatum TaxID=110093 RepID=UPI0022FE08FD|nr:uncharacterized protein BJ171DRAFT_505117 [Polychytrium aggregatum]KAI9204697.1 hypothetical protein BJ171DRAFT_505117 [Polychytrium aggregatum]
MDPPSTSASFTPETIAWGHFSLVLVVFAAVIVFCVHPVVCSFRRPALSWLRFVPPRIRIHFDLATTPILAIVVLLACGTIGLEQLKNGFLGGDGIEPYSILLLVLALAYICISIDVSGLFAFIAHQVTRRGGRSGMGLFRNMFVLSTLMTIFTSNDVVVLTVTPILCHFSKMSKVNPSSFLMSSFIVCNIASMALYIGNPTNVIVAQAYQINFLQYSAWMLLPTLVSIAIAYGLSLFWFRSLIPAELPAPTESQFETTEDERTHHAIRDKFGAVFGVTVLLVCLVTLMMTSLFANVNVAYLTLPFAALMLIKDVVSDYLWARGTSSAHSGDTRPLELGWRRAKAGNRASATAEPVYQQVDTQRGTEVDLSDVNLPTAAVSGDAAAANKRLQHDPSSDPARKVGSTDSLDNDNDNGNDDDNGNDKTDSGADDQHELSGDAARRHRFVTMQILARMPWKLGPFLVGMFVLVEALSFRGFTPLLAQFLAMLAPSLAAAVFAIGLVTTIACNLLNNLPMAILFTRALQHPLFLQSLTMGQNKTLQDAQWIQRGSLFALIIGSNLGANLLFIGSLAGLMWSELLDQSGIREVTHRRFMLWCLGITPPVLAGACGVLLAEMAIMNR